MEEEGRKWETHVRDARGVGESWDGKDTVGKEVEGTGGGRQGEG